MSTQTTHRFAPRASRGWLQHFGLSVASIAAHAFLHRSRRGDHCPGNRGRDGGVQPGLRHTPPSVPLSGRGPPGAGVHRGAERAGAERNASLLDIEDYNRRSSLLENIGGYTVFNSQIEGDGPAEAVVIAQ